MSAKAILAAVGWTAVACLHVYLAATHLAPFVRAPSFGNGWKGVGALAGAAILGHLAAASLRPRRPRA